MFISSLATILELIVWFVPQRFISWKVVRYLLPCEVKGDLVELQEVETIVRALSLEEVRS